ncbi:MAG: CPBP family intramembrane glutamic endopeptidase [Steroidobacteraceae bacterium]|nr:CPBP family intramembrane metalloprotease [Nevskiaceae bacterium]MCP5360888.1 CPBP family intramembrane metalloprotease [Nevskiaceae bacterium]MCP5466271.1 CPBP family intramembrane metalloprotease [Nevskiaceae bacterium]MCP5471673.1 CPBP family intramembrane metalloprotease [Nevskiaceae bacterium]
MRAFLAFFALILLTLAVAAGLAWPAWELLTPQFDLRFHRVASRVWMLLVLIGIVLLARRLAVADRGSLGYGAPRRIFLRETGIGLALGVATMLPIVLLMFAAGLRASRADVALDTATLLRLAAAGLGTGLTVALIEETFLRGAMHSAVQRESGPVVAILLIAPLYAATHFLASYRIPPGQLGPGSGFDLLAGSLAAFGQPLSIIDAFLCLTAVGVLLGLVRALTGNIAACIGLHAGWVWVISVVREASRPVADHPAGWLLSDFDGVVGWLVLAWCGVIGAVLVRFYRYRDASTVRENLV